MINESMQMKSVSKVQSGYYFLNGLISLPYGYPYLEDFGKEKHKYRAIHKSYKRKSTTF